MKAVKTSGKILLKHLKGVLRSISFFLGGEESSPFLLKNTDLLKISLGSLKGPLSEKAFVAK